MSPFAPTDRDLTPALSRVVLLLAGALALVAISASVAQAQSGGATPPPTTVPPPTTGGPAQVFPVPGAHSFGDGFGASRGGRSHQGVDIFAACGEPTVAVARSTVAAVGFQGSAGNYLVLRSKKLRRDFFYAHLQAPPSVVKKQKVAPGQAVGLVGDSGNASGCHLHFEIWKGKWYRGGRAIDPMPALQAWDASS